MRWTNRAAAGSLAAGLLASLVLASCGAAGPSLTASGTPATSPAPTVTPSAPGSGSPASAGAASTIEDPAGDASLGYVDILEVRADARGGQLELEMRLAAPPPASSVEAGLLTYAFGLDVNGDGQPDRSAALELVPEGGFRPVLVDLASGGRVEGAQFPGTAGLSGTDVTISLSLDAISCPASIGVRGSSDRTQKSDTIRDDVPDPTAEPLIVRTGC